MNILLLPTVRHKLAASLFCMGMAAPAHGSASRR